MHYMSSKIVNCFVYSSILTGLQAVSGGSGAVTAGLSCLCERF